MFNREENRPSASDLESVYESELKSQQAIADIINRDEQLRYKLQKEHERRDLERINAAGERLKAMGMDEFEVFDWKLRMGAFNVSRVKPPQIINIIG